MGKNTGTFVSMLKSNWDFLLGFPLLLLAGLVKDHYSGSNFGHGLLEVIYCLLFLCILNRSLLVVKFFYQLGLFKMVNKTSNSFMEVLKSNSHILGILVCPLLIGYMFDHPYNIGYCFGQALVISISFVMLLCFIRLFVNVVKCMKDNNEE